MPDFQPPHPTRRPRRLRSSEAIRRMVRGPRLSPDDLIFPLFVHEGREVTEISSMPGVQRHTFDSAVQQAQQAWELGIPAIILFGIPNHKDAQGTQAYAAEGVVQEATRRIKAALPDMAVLADTCLCEYTDHGHCGHLVQRSGEWTVDNDSTLALLARTAVSQARAGADIVAPSAMMDGQIAALRGALDAAGFEGVPVMSYAVKYASAYYGPFRDAAGSAPDRGNRAGYQMDAGGDYREALREARIDVGEGADFLMVKPALAYLDVLRQLRDHFDLPLVAYNVSGEYALVKAAAQAGYMDERRTVLETLGSMRRAGADIIMTYHALDAARWLREG